MFQLFSKSMARAAQLRQEEIHRQNMEQNICANIANMTWLAREAGRKDAFEIIDRAFRTSASTAFPNGTNSDLLFSYNEHLRVIMFKAVEQEPHQRLPFLVQELHRLGEHFRQHQIKGETVIS